MPRTLRSASLSAASAKHSRLGPDRVRLPLRRSSANVRNRRCACMLRAVPRPYTGMGKCCCAAPHKSSAAASISSSMASQRQTASLKPRALRSGDTIGVVAPASYFARQDFEAGCEALRGLGYKVVFDEAIFERDLYFAGSAQRRARELESMFARADVDAIICA